MSFEEIEVTRPEEIYGSVRYTAEQAEDELSHVALNHEHTSAIRGYGERVAGLDQRVDTDLGYDLEHRREDGGDTWYHSPESRCLMIGVPRDEERNTEEVMSAWGKGLSRQLENYLEEEGVQGIDPVYASSEDFSGNEPWDVYDSNSGRQLFGLSTRMFPESTVVRTCFYDGRNHGEHFQEMIEEDVEDEDFNDNYISLNGFYDWILDQHGTDIVNPDLKFSKLDVDNDIRRESRPCITRIEETDKLKRISQ